MPEVYKSSNILKTVTHEEAESDSNIIQTNIIEN